MYSDIQSNTAPLGVIKEFKLRSQRQFYVPFFNKW